MSEDTLATRPNIFVFGSNLSGRHGKGAALCARQKHGAVYGVGVGRTGSSYAIPTKGADTYLTPLSLTEIQGYVFEFIHYAKVHPELHFEVTRVGCGLAGYMDHDIAPLFKSAPDNCTLPEEWRVWL